MPVRFLGLFSRFTFLVSQLTATVTSKHEQAWMYSQLTIKKTRQIKKSAYQSSPLSVFSLLLLYQSYNQY